MSKIRYFVLDTGDCRVYACVDQGGVADLLSCKRDRVCYWFRSGRMRWRFGRYEIFKVFDTIESKRKGGNLRNIKGGFN